MNIWKESLAALRQNWRIALILVLAEAFLKVPLSMMTGVGVDWVKLVIFGALQILVLYAGCRWVLYGAIRFDLPKLLKFVVRALILQLLIILPAQLYFVSDAGSIALLCFPVMSQSFRKAMRKSKSPSIGSKS